MISRRVPGLQLPGGNEAVAFIDSYVSRAPWNLHVEVLFWLVGSAHVAGDEESS